MAEFGTLMAASTLIEQSFTLLGRVQTAVERQKGFSNYLNELSCGITTTKDIVGLVRDERDLNTKGVLKAIRNVVKVVTALEGFLINLENGAMNGQARQIVHQLFKGSKEQQKLDEMKSALLAAKSDLSLYIQLAHVGLIRDASEAVVNAILVDRIDRLLQTRLGQGQGLHIATLIKQRPRNEDGMVHVTDEDLKKLPTPPEKPPAEFNTTPGTSSRIVRNNLTYNQALQVNAPIGTEGWREVNSLTIKDNVARDESTQINHAVGKDVFLALLARHSGIKS